MGVLESSASRGLASVLLRGLQTLDDDDDAPAARPRSKHTRKTIHKHFTHLKLYVHTAYGSVRLSSLNYRYVPSAVSTATAARDFLFRLLHFACVCDDLYSSIS